MALHAAAAVRLLGVLPALALAEGVVALALVATSPFPVAFAWTDPVRSVLESWRAGGFPALAALAMVSGLVQRVGGWSEALRRVRAELHAADGRLSLLVGLVGGVAAAARVTEWLNPFPWELDRLGVLMLVLLPLHLATRAALARRGLWRDAAWLRRCPREARARFGPAVALSAAVLALYTLVAFDFTVVKAHLFHLRLPADASLVALEDAVLGARVRDALTEWARSSPAVTDVLDDAYFRVFHLVVLTTVTLGLARRREGQLRFVGALSLCYLVGGPAYYLWPSLGPLFTQPERFAFLSDSWRVGPPIAELLRQSTFGGLRGELRELRPFLFIAAMPSLHVAQAVVIAHHARGELVWSAVAWVLAALSVVATVALGWHYLLDVVGGVALAVGCLIAVRRLAARLWPAGPPPSLDVGDGARDPEPASDARAGIGVTGAPSPGSRWFVLGALGVSAFVLGRLLLGYLGAGHDDTWIALFAAEELARGHGLVTHDGLPGEIGSSLLHVLALAGLARLGASDLYLANKALGAAAGALTVAVLLARRRDWFASLSRERAGGAALLSVWITGSSVTFLFWTMGGLETPLVGLLVALLVSELAASRPRAGVLALVLVGLVAARPEGVLYALLVPLLRRRLPRPRLLTVAALPWGAFAALTALRWGLTGHVAPLPVLAKVGGDAPLARLAGGLEYAAAFAVASPLHLALLAGAVAVALRTGAARLGRDRRALLALVGLQGGLAVVAGGDWMTYYRFLYPALPALAALGAHAILGTGRSVVGALPAAPRRAALLALAVAVVLAGSVERSHLGPFGMTDTNRVQRLWDALDPAFGAGLGDRARRLNVPYARDEGDLFPFVDGPLRRVAERAERLQVVSYQFGAFAYRVRRAGLDVALHDPMGVCDPRTATLGGARNALGLEDGRYPERFLDPASGSPLARHLAAVAPDVVYVLDLSREQREAVERLGYRVVWDRPDAKVLARAALAPRFRAVSAP